MTRQDTHHIKSSWIIVVHWLWIVIIELIESYDELDQEWGLCWVKQTSSVIFNLECFHEECRRSCWNCWFCEPGICSSTRRSLSKPPPSLTCPGQGSPSRGGAGAVALVAQGAHGCGCLGQALSCMVTARAPGLTLPWGLRLRWEWALRVLLHHLGACTGSCPALRAVVLFHWGSYLLLKQACYWTCISQCISQWIALHIASHDWIQTHDLHDESSQLNTCLQSFTHTENAVAEGKHNGRDTPIYAQPLLHFP